MNELSNLMLTSKRARYRINIESLTQAEYKLILNSIEENDKFIHSNDNGYTNLKNVKEKLIKNHEMFNKNWGGDRE